ncbi:MAG TPA: tRNA lysidine(34) synthetase TilS [Gemmatimonadetes bacterium]|nr:tRNA lysidine(34) synthetase TilS [Gemmatimonadota bacterium]
MNGDQVSLVRRFQASFRSARSSFLSDAPIVVAVSGGLDSVALLHLFRFVIPQSHQLHAAHFDHYSRENSAADAKWVSGLCHAWGVELELGRANEALMSEESARNARHVFLESVRTRVGGGVVVMGHHADDQAETVLFRMVRGSGLKGLSGMSEYREPGVWRPLLPFWRDEIALYAQQACLNWREDPTNREPRFTRNILRNNVLPEIESMVAPAARRSLVRLADLAREDEEAWLSILDEVLGSLELEEDRETISLDFQRITELHGAVRGRILREVAKKLGYQMDAIGTRLASDFVDSKQSGRQIDLTGGLRLRRDLSRLVFFTEVVNIADRPLLISKLQPGSGSALLGGRELLVKWSPEKNYGLMSQSLTLASPRFPLTIRGRRPGDRIRLTAGTRKLKKLFLEARIPEPKRSQVPLLVDGVGSVLWIPGVAEATGHGDISEAKNVLHIGISDAKAV